MRGSAASLRGVWSEPAAEVSACGASREEASPGPSIKVWLGYLKPEFVSCVDFPLEGEDSEQVFLDASLGRATPHALSLVNACSEAFSFVSATSGDQRLPRTTSGGQPSMPGPASDQGARLDRVESLLDSLQATLGSLASHLDGVHPGGVSSGGVGFVAPTPKPVAGPPPGLEAKAYPSLAPQTVTAARSAGVSEAQLARVQALVGAATHRTSMADTAQRPKPAAPQVGNPLSESEDDVDAEDGEPAGPRDGVAKAVTQLTKIVQNLSEKRKEPNTLEGLLERAESRFDYAGSGGSGSASAARSKAAALRALQRAVQTQPEALSHSMLGAMEEDLLARRSSGAFTGQSATARAWFEHRSRVGYFPTTIRIGWAICGCIDLLREGKQAEALCRLLLLLSALDQAAIDQGSWSLSQEALLEATTPPFGSFQRRSHIDTLETPHTRLLQARWIELMIHRLKEKDAYTEMRKKIGKPSSTKPDGSSDAKEEEGNAPGRARRRGGGRGGGQSSSTA